MSFWTRVDIRGPDECWPWQGSRTSDGYGNLRFEGEYKYAHQVAFKLTNGHWPTDQTRHSCDNRPCCNPAHLLDGTPADNSADMVERGRSNRGSRNGSAKLTEADVIAIRADTRVHREIAADYGVHNMQISRIKARKTWGHVK